MNNRFKSWISAMLALVIVIAMFPADIAKAATAPAPAPGGQYFQFKKFSTEESAPTMVNEGNIDLEGSFNGVSADSISFQVDSIVGGQVIPGANGADVKPIIQNEKNFRFPGVKISQGLNRITVYGITADGSKASGAAYVNFSNVPAIYDIKLPDGKVLSTESPTVVSTSTLTIMLQAPNAVEVVVNNKKMYNGGSSTFVLSDIPLVPGLNKLNFVATTDAGTRTYSVSRDVICAPDTMGTPFNTKIGSEVVESNSIISSALHGAMSGSILFKTPEDTTVSKPTTFKITVTNKDTNTVVTPVGGIVATISGTEVNGKLTTFKYSTSEAVNITANGNYIIKYDVRYDGKSVYELPFSYRKSDSAYITDVQQLYGVKDNGATVSYSSSSQFTGDNNLFELPIYLQVKTNKVTDASKVTIKSFKNGASVSNFTTVAMSDQSGYRVYKITGMPTGEQVLKIEVTNGGNVEDSKSFLINYISAPFVELSNVYNNQVFSDVGKFTEIKGRLVNFNTSDYSSLNISINGTTKPLGASASDFTFAITPDMMLVSGPNTLSITGVANGVPISTNLTLYLFPDKLPIVDGLKPLPVGKTEDKDLAFKVTGKMQYSTYEKNADIQFIVSNAEQVVLTVDGKQLAISDLDSTSGEWKSKDGNGSPYGNLTAVPIGNNSYRFTLSNSELPKSGVKNYVIGARLGTATISQVLQITRELLPYAILSPKLPNESVIKQNFLDVSILAEGADQVLVGKTPMVKGDKDIFRLQVKSLKKGKNTIKFTVFQGTQKLNGQIDVVYSDEVLQGAQYKTQLTSSGKLSAFKGTISIAFPKGTMLRDATPTPGDTNTRTINLFNNPDILIGIADKQDGRTVKVYNPVGEKDDLGEYKDGKLAEISANAMMATAYMPPKLHYGFSSDLFWIDPGYFKNYVSPNDYDLVEGTHPYKQNNEFFGNHIGKWLEPSQQGTITLSYDPNIVNIASSSISVWKNNNGTWVNMGGKVNTSNKTITATFDGFGYYTVMSLRYSFDDIVAHPTARPDLELMLAKGIMSPKDPNQFGVYDNLTRGEFATMVVKMLNIPLDYDPNNLTFGDVVKYDDYRWDYRYIETAVRKGIIRGTAPRVFSPNGSLSREEAANIIARATNLKLGDTAKDLPALQKAFTDTNTIVSPYSVTSIQAVVKAGLMTGVPNKLLAGQKKQTYRFDPTAFMTRADAASIAKKIMAKMKKL
ncbi:S-layer homology domain-containing protein [Paenibacillus pini]|uniref:SLH domain-containing protein n=1 Tax=Paenibacillus pini JCM 16418 TaxID=1236976 RepID=W7YTL1_9BACL|nr:S-layer homology domain-containing protein [Paenibacillus pini]GAF10528.1 hypothetical protein JCM16418_4738 [Paenibacillus pini JCM 16418]